METSIDNGPCVLVVDDDIAIREIVADILELAGIPSIPAENGQQAIELFQQYRRQIKAILLDVTMPVLDGNEAYLILRELDANVRIIISSGYDEKLSSLTNDIDHSLTYLRKPYTMDALLACINHALS